MRFRKQKSQQGRVRQAASPDTRQAFSYYSSPAATARRVEDRRGMPPPRSASTSQTPRRAIGLLRYSVLLVCLVIAGVCLIKLLVITPSSRIVLSGQTPNYAKTSEQAYADKANALLGGSVLNRSKITLDTEGIAKEMKTTFPELESVVVTVPIVGNRPVIYIAPAHAVMRLETASGSYLLSSTGYAFEGDLTSSEAAGLPRLLDLTGVRPEPDTPFLPISTVEFATTVNYQLTQAGITVESLMLPQGAPYELDVRVAGQPYIVKFNLEENAKEQSGAAVAVIKQLGGKTPASYIDVRVPGKAYYK